MMLGSLSVSSKPTAMTSQLQDLSMDMQEPRYPSSKQEKCFSTTSMDVKEPRHSSKQEECSWTTLALSKSVADAISSGQQRQWVSQVGIELNTCSAVQGIRMRLFQATNGPSSCLRTLPCEKQS